MRWLALLFVAGCQSSDVSRELGAECGSNDDCDDRCLLPSDGFAGGFCTVSCNSNADCPAASACTDVQGGVCLFTCASSCTFLGDGYACGSFDSRGGGAKISVCGGT